MDTYGEQFHTVRVLRHTFLPNEPLQAELQNFLKDSEKRTRPSIRLASTRAVAVDSYEFQNYRYDLALHDIQSRFMARSGGIALNAVRYAFSPNGDFKLRFTPSDMSSFTALTDPIDELRDPIERSERKGVYYLDTTLNARHLIGREALQSSWRRLHMSFQDVDMRRLYSAIPQDIAGPERTVLRRPSNFVE